MAADRIDTEVVVVGAGPVGLMLAGELRLGGAEVTVLDRREGPTTESRASTLHARTMEILDSRGLLETLGTPSCEMRGHFGGIPVDLALPSPYPGQWKVPQTRTEELLGRWAASSGADVRRTCELRGLTVTEDHVEAEAVGPEGPVRVRGRYLVGCDGEDSTVRRLTGAPFPGRDAGRELLRADVAGIDIPDRRFERLEHGLAIAARRADGVTRVMVHEFGSAAASRTGEPDFTEVTQAWKSVTGEDISTGTPLWVNSFGDANRQLARYRHGRVLFAGDAAHRQMPAGGQALNLGLQDAVNLGWKLAAAVRGWAPPGLLDSYDTERREVGRRVLANIRTQAHLLLGGPESDPLRILLGELLAREDVRRHLAAMICGLDVRYEAGAGGHPLLGARLPHVSLATPWGPAITTTAMLRPGRGLLLDLAGNAAVRGAARPWADRVTVVTGRPVPPAGPGTPPGPLDGTDAVLVRPDGHIVWTTMDGGGLPQALLRWFGAGQAAEPPTGGGTGG